MHIVRFILLLLTVSCQIPGAAQSKINEPQLDMRTRAYLSPTRIVWQSDQNNTLIQNADRLLLPGNGQADLVSKDLCVLKGSPNGETALLLDFGKELHGGIQLVSGMFEGKEPIRVRITLGESVSEAMSRVGHSTATNDHALRDFEIGIPWLGKIEIGNSGFRFARIDLLDQDRQLLLKEVRAIAIYRDIPYIGDFRSSDKRLNDIWRTGAYTVHLNMQDYLWDGIKRDRLVWVGDMHPEVMTILSVFGANEVVPKSLDLIQAITPIPEWMNGISSYSMWWVLIQYQWYLHTGNEDYLQQHQEYLFGLLAALEEHIDAGGSEQLDGNRFLDWPTSPNKPAIHAGLQALMVMTFEAGSAIALTLDRAPLSAHYLQTAKRLKKHVPDPNDNKSAAALMALAGLEKSKRINRKFLAPNANQGVSTFYGYYVLQARALASDYQGALDVIRDYWGAMLDLGATTFWEDFNLDWAENAGRIDELLPDGKIDLHADYGDYCYVGLRHSLCHGWASGPTAWLSEHVLGIQVLEPGCKKVRIEPHLADLEWVEGSFPTPYGPIRVKHRQLANGRIESTIDAPEEVEIIKN